MAWKVYDYYCHECGTKEERLVKANCIDEEVCESCEGLMDRLPCAPVGWIKDPARTAMQLKKRSHDQTQRCLRKGIPLDDPSSLANVDPEWRNRTRAKNTSRDTINQHRYDHLGWDQKPTAEFHLGGGDDLTDVNLKPKE